MDKHMTLWVDLKSYWDKSNIFLITFYYTNYFLLFNPAKSVSAKYEVYIADNQSLQVHPCILHQRGNHNGYGYSLLLPIMSKVIMALPTLE